MITRVYISGPMTGFPDSNAQAFRTAEARLRDLGYQVISPLEISENVNAALEHPTWCDYIAADIEAIGTLRPGLDYIYFLEGHEESPGCQIEMIAAKRNGIDRLHDCSDEIGIYERH